MHNLCTAPLPARRFVFFVSLVVPPSSPLSADERLERQMRFIIEADKLKEVFRQSLVTQSRRRENSAEHSWHFALMIITLAEHSNHQPLDVLRVLKMVLLHDLVEIDAGDTYAYDTKNMVDQHAREAVAATRIFGLLPPDQTVEFRALWDEFEAKETPEAKFAAACDRFHPMLLNCLTGGETWTKHGVTHDMVVARNQHAAEGSQAIWAYALRLIDEAVASGALARKAD
ncbi:MAG: HD domain-containing protein [Candidatus Didemnitutus sp.]|nr:HD domain-containing protein [Candidatus Didemnitutus sp.]